MCIVFFALNYGRDPAQKCPKCQQTACDGYKFPLVVAFNRDENVWRESTKLDKHEHKAADGSTQTILYGTDVRTGTTWFGVNLATGKFAFLTNYR